jgi:N-acetyl-gamma-glutamyl-phosphate reductase
LCLGHGNSTSFLKKHPFSSTTKIIDLSNDFRLTKDKNLQEKSFVYGLPELQKEAIKKADYIANPGCFATALQLAILPLAASNLLQDDVHIHAVTGATGAGTSLSKTTHFTWRDNNFSHYKAFNHQHLGEIHQTVQQLQTNFDSDINFVPNRGNFSRGIFATTYTKFEGSLKDAKNLYKAYYKDAAFTFVSDESIHLKQVVNTNKCIIQLEKHDNKLLITSTIDNLLKGASGQAVQNMNLMYDFEETLGLNLKASYF